MKRRISLDVRVEHREDGRVGTIVGKFPRAGVAYPWYVRWDGVTYLDTDDSSGADGPYATADLKLHASDHGR
jgi:hypothetical protein